MRSTKITAKTLNFTRVGIQMMPTDALDFLIRKALDDLDKEVDEKYDDVQHRTDNVQITLEVWHDGYHKSGGYEEVE